MNAIGSVTNRLRTSISAPLRRRFERFVTARPYVINVSSESRELDGKVAVVTGASGAIGRAIAIRLAAEGARTILVGRDASRLQSVASEISAHGNRAIPHVVDLSSATEIESLFSALDRVDILVNAAGGSSRDSHAPLWTQSVDVIDEILRVNLRAAMLCTRWGAAHMIEAGKGGRVILVGSTVGVGGKAHFTDYAATKSALVGYARSAAIELGPHEVTVNCVSPGIIPRGALTERELAHTAKKNVIPRVGRNEDVAECVAFLVSSRGSFITGQNVIIDGGRSLGLRGDS